MPFQIQPCSPADAPGLAKAMMGARLTDPHWVTLWENPSAEPIIACATARLPWTLLSGGDAKRHEKIIEAETGQVVGYARWTLPDHLAKSDIWPQGQVAEVSPDERAMYETKYQENSVNGQPAGVRTDGVMAYRSAPLEEIDARIMKDRPFLILDYLTTDPGFWRRGLGKMMVRSGLDIADRYQIKAYVMSSPAALKLYLSVGFELVDTVSTDYSQFGGTEPSLAYFLVRKPSER